MGLSAEPYGLGWLFEVEDDPATVSEQLGHLLDADAYRRPAASWTTTSTDAGR